MTEVRRLLLYAMAVEWQWNNDSRPGVSHAQGGLRNLHGRYKLSLKHERGTPHELKRILKTLSGTREKT
jgi:hypothetical protein